MNTVVPFPILLATILAWTAGVFLARTFATHPDFHTALEHSFIGASALFLAWLVW